MRLNPSDDYQFEEGDELVVLAEDDDTYHAAATMFDHSTDAPPPIEQVEPNASPSAS